MYMRPCCICPERCSPATRTLPINQVFSFMALFPCNLFIYHVNYCGKVLCISGHSYIPLQTKFHVRAMEGHGVQVYENVHRFRCSSTQPLHNQLLHSSNFFSHVQQYGRLQSEVSIAMAFVLPVGVTWVPVSFENQVGHARAVSFLTLANFQTDTLSPFFCFAIYNTDYI